jgi:hypothetical protein
LVDEPGDISTVGLAAFHAMVLFDGDRKAV